MALNGSPWAVAMMDSTKLVSGLKDDMGSEDVTYEYITETYVPMYETWPAAYDSYALEGTVIGASVPTSDPSIIRAFFLDVLNNAYTDGHTVISKMAQMFCDYWETVYTGGAQTAGPPMHGGIEIISVVNDAQSFYGAFYAAIVAHRDKVASTINQPFWEEFISDIEVVVKQITWTVTELVIKPPPEPVAFPEKIA